MSHESGLIHTTVSQCCARMTGGMKHKRARLGTAEDVPAIVQLMHRAFASEAGVHF